MTPLAAAKELVYILEQLEPLLALEKRKWALLDIVAGKTAVKAPKAGEGKAILWPRTALQEEASKASREELEKRITDKPKKWDKPADRSSAEILADDGMGHRTPEEQARIEAEAMSVYDANVDPASNKQKAMIFAMLASDFNVLDNTDQKAVIVGIIEQLHGVKIDKISKELSKAWAGDTIDWLIKAKPADVSKWIVPF